MDCRQQPDVGTAIAIELQACTRMRAGSHSPATNARLTDLVRHDMANLDPRLRRNKPTRRPSGQRTAAGYLVGEQIGVTVDPCLSATYYQHGQLPSQRSPTHDRHKHTGKSWGGAQTTTHEQYEEHTVTNGEAFSTNDSWGTATAVDSAHAADLWFTYKVRNAGTEYAREISTWRSTSTSAMNPNPACTYHVGSTACGVPVDTVLFSNFMPGEEHTYTSFRVPLTLEQMKAIDLGGPVRVVVEDFDYGADELFYQDAANADVQLAIEDGTADGDESHRHLPDPHLGHGDRARRAGPLLPAHHRRERHADRGLDAGVPRRHAGLVRRAESRGHGQPADAVVQARALHRRLVERVHERHGRRLRGLPGHAGRAGPDRPVPLQLRQRPRRLLRPLGAAPGHRSRRPGLLPPARAARRRAQHPQRAASSPPPSRC